MKAGLYEALVTQTIDEVLRAYEDNNIPVKKRRLHSAEASDRLALHMGRVVFFALSSIPDKDRANVGNQLIRDLITEIDRTVAKGNVAQDQLLQSNEVLTSILSRNPDGTVAEISEPLTPLLDTTLLTNARGEPRVGSEILTEIESADRIDIVMAFIRVSGIRPFIDKLKKHCDEAHEKPNLRILTTTYTGSTELRALEKLQAIGAHIKVSYDTTCARLHAKAWHFHRESGASTAYIGSSNLTYSAQESGIEWNVRVSGLRNPDVIRKMTSMFDAYWAGGDFRDFDAGDFASETKADRTTGRAPALLLSPIEIRLEPFQERLLEQINVARRQGRHRNLLVAATGTGKTVMAAVDYSRLRQVLSRCRLLFVAHREEILDQSLATFRYALREPSFGEKWVGSHRPRQFDHVFASIQSLNATGLTNLNPSHFDVVIVDEFHHAAAPSYAGLLSHIQPRELLGLTATPERTDGLSVLEWFDGRIAAELRLWDAIDQHRLVPFIYFGIHDGLDLRDIPWRRGRGYDTSALSNLYTADDAWARRVIKEVSERKDDYQSMKALGFCVSVQHAQFMAKRFNAAGIQAIAVWGNTPEAERREALQHLAEGKIRILFSVDLFNEGVDVPLVDTLLLLRPTESATLFLQQLGRGLRKSSNKSFCTVLDFVGTHRKEFRFDSRLSALLGGNRRYLQQQIKHSFPFLPAGCHMELDRKTEAIILNSLQSAIPSAWPAKVEELRKMLGDGLQPTLEDYLSETGLELSDIYAQKKCWSDLLDAAGGITHKRGPNEPELRRSIGRLLHVDDEERLDFYNRILSSPHSPDTSRLSQRELRMLRMLVAGTCSQLLDATTSLAAGLPLLWQHPQVVAELREVFTLRRKQIDHVHESLDSHHAVPLQVHAKYSRIDILAALGVGEYAKTPSWREGVRWVPSEGVDALAFTLDKSDGKFSPTTMYRDYAISRELIHWESQSNTRADSPTGIRYRNHVAKRTKIMLFARESTSHRAFWFLGLATYVSHQSERPMEITWKLERPLPGDLFSRFAAAVA